MGPFEARPGESAKNDSAPAHRPLLEYREPKPKSAPNLTSDRPRGEPKPGGPPTGGVVGVGPMLCSTPPGKHTGYASEAGYSGMIDPETVRTVTLALGGSWLAKKLLGPTLDLLGIEIKQLTQKRLENLKKIVNAGQRKLNNRRATRVAPRIIKEIIREGTLNDDSVATEYWGGVLAASVTGIDRDDRGVAILSLLSRLSTYQLRTHYILYRVLRELYVGKRRDLGSIDDFRLMQAYVRLDTYHKAMAFDRKESSREAVILGHVLAGLARESLIDGRYRFGEQSHLEILSREAPAPGIIFQPTPFGLEVFLWAYGKGDAPANKFLDPRTKFRPLEGVVIPSGYAAVPLMMRVHRIN